MGIAKNALLLFIKSLPPDSFFEVISFGSHYDYLSFKNRGKTLEYTEQNVRIALDKIQKFDATFGGTNIENPLRVA